MYLSLVGHGRVDHSAAETSTSTSTSTSTNLQRVSRLAAAALLHINPPAATTSALAITIHQQPRTALFSVYTKPSLLTMFTSPSPLDFCNPP